MNIELHVSRSRPWRWIQRLAVHLEQANHRINIVFDPDDTPNPLPSGLVTLLMLETTIFGLHGKRQSDLLAPAEFPSPSIAGDGLPDLIFDFTGRKTFGSGSEPKCKTLVPLYNGQIGEESLFASIMNGHAPHVALVGLPSLRQCIGGYLAIDDLSVVSRAISQVFARLQTLCMKAVALNASLAGDPGSAYLPAAIHRLPSAAGFLGLQLVEKIVARLRELVSVPHHWRIAWRRTNGAGVWETRSLEGEPFTVIRDDGRRYFADPFPFYHDGRVFVFFEELPYATRKGIISFCEILGDGSASPAEPIIDTNYHLSYPFIFEHRGSIWMIPETSENHTIELWRSVRFPGAWERHAILVDNITATDATLWDNGDRLWLFATTRHEDASCHDTLHLWHADRLEGQWRSHESNPLLFDSRAARPAGAMRMVGGALWRPAQDCSEVYGGALSLCTVGELHPWKPFRQTIVHRLVPEPQMRATGLHTLNEAGGIEFIDLCGTSRKSFSKHDS